MLLRGSIRKPLLLGLPIYYSSTARSFVASTHVRLLRAFGLPIEEDRGALPEFFLYRYVTAPRTLFHGISALPIGGQVRALLEGGQIAVTQPTWTDVFRKSTTLYHLEESAARIKEDLEHSIQSLQPRRDQVTCLMSGGVDSSILFKMCQDHLALRASHSTGYPFEADEYNDERKYAETAAAAFGSEHTYHAFTTQDFLQGVVESIDHAEVPVVAMQSALLDLVFNRALPDDQRVVISGQGADSVFGLSIMYHYQETRRVVKPALAPVFKLLANTLGRLPQGDHQFPWARMHAFSKRRWDLDFGNIDHGLWLMGEFADKDWVKSTFAVDDEALLEGRRAAIGQFSLNHVLDAFTVLDFVSDVAYMQDVWGKLGDGQGTLGLFSVQLARTHSGCEPHPLGRENVPAQAPHPARGPDGGRARLCPVPAEEDLWDQRQALGSAGRSAGITVPRCCASRRHRRAASVPGCGRASGDDGLDAGQLCDLEAHGDRRRVCG